MAETKHGGRGTALVTGASSGIGLELARLLALEGHDLVLVARRREALDALAIQLEGMHHVRARVAPMDLGDPGAPGELFNQLQATGVAVDTLVNDAGFALHGAFVESDLGRELNMIQVNVVALTQLTKLFAKAMVQGGRGRILNVASTAAFVPGPYMAVYYATKAYVLSFSEALAAELKGTGVTVTALCPGPTRSGFEARADTTGTRLFRSHVMEAEAVAREAYRGMVRGKRLVIPGPRNRLLVGMLRVVPRGTALRTSRRMAEKA